MGAPVETPSCLLYVSPETQPWTLSPVRPGGAFERDQASSPCLGGWWVAREPGLLLPAEALLAWSPGAGAGAREQPICLLAVLLFFMEGFVPQEVPIIPGAHCAVCGLIPHLYAQAGLEGEGWVVSRGTETAIMCTLRCFVMFIYKVLSLPSLAGGTQAGC